MEQTDGNNRPITLKDLIEALTEAEARIEDRIVKGVVAAVEERLESLETKLLTEFHGYGWPRRQPRSRRPLYGT